MVFPFSKRDRRQFDGPFPQRWLDLLGEHVILYGLLTEAEQARLRHIVRVLIAEKFWEGCAGLTMTDEIRVAIAGQAALLLLGFDDYFFDELQTILVYPGGFLSVDKDPLGLEERVEYHLGEAFQGGPVILSWWDARWAGKRLGHVNVVLHEFAHKFAELGDPEAGKPPLLDPALAERWEEIVGPEYEQLVEDADYSRPSLLDPYGAESRAEFFAVATECFFLQPVALQRRHPALYQLLAGCYRQDPASRSISEAVATSAKGADEEYARHALAECTAALQQHPDFLDAYRERIGFLCDLGDYDSALADCATLIHRAETEGEKAGAYHERGIVQREAGKLDEAIADFTEAVRLNDEFAPAWCDRGAVHAERGENEQALADLTQAIRLDSRDDAALIERGCVHRELGQLEKALRDLTKAIRLCPHVPDAYIQRARVYRDKGEFEQALADCEEALRLDPEDAESLHVRDEVREASRKR